MGRLLLALLRGGAPALPPLRPVFLVAVLALSGCGLFTRKQAQAPPTPVRMQLDWLHTVDSAQFYMAEDKGFFAEDVIVSDILNINN